MSSELEIFLVMRYINVRFTYLLTFTYVNYRYAYAKLLGECACCLALFCRVM